MNNKLQVTKFTPTLKIDTIFLVFGEGMKKIRANFLTQLSTKGQMKNFGTS